MNTANNKRKQESVKRIKEAFMILFNEKEIGEITVNDICKLANVNRTTFYASFKDLFDLIESIKFEYEQIIIQKVKQEEQYGSKLSKLFHDIYKNQLLYKTYIKLFFDYKQKSNLLSKIFNEYNTDTIKKYRLTFFRAGLASIVKEWLNTGCKESPEEMLGILKEEYGYREEMNFKK